MATTQRLPDEEDDSLAELPELDGDDENEEDDTGGQAEDGAELDIDEGGKSDLDDATGEGDPLDELSDERGERERSWLGGDAEGSDLAGVDAVPEILDNPPGGASLVVDDEEEGMGDEEFDLESDESRHASTDLGEEGPTDADEELRDEDLPALDSDEDEDVDDGTLYELAVFGDEGAGPWPEEPWLMAMSPLDVGHVVAVACAPRGVVARLESGDVIQIDLDGEVKQTDGADDELRRLLAGDPRLDAASKEEAEESFGVRRPGGEVTAIAEIDSSTWIVALFDPTDGRSVLVRATRSPAIGTAAAPAVSPRIVISELKGRVCDLAWDAARELVWAASDTGVVPLHPRVSRT